MQNNFTLKKMLNNVKFAFFTVVMLLSFTTNMFAQTTITTVGTYGPVNNGNGFVTFNFKNNNTFDVVLTGISSVLNLASGTATVSGHFKPGAIAAAPGAISTANGWTQFASAVITSNGNTTDPQTFFTNGNLIVPAGQTYGICVNAFSGTTTTGALRYYGTGTASLGNFTINGGGCSILSGDNISFAGAGIPNAPANTPRMFVGTVTFATATTCTASPALGTTVSSVPTVCPGINFNLSTSVPPVAGVGGILYQWQSATALAGPYSNIAGATSATLTTTQTAATFYQLTAKCGANATTTSTPIQVALTPNNQCYCTPSVTSCAASDVINNVTFAGINNTSACSASGGYTNFTSTVAAGTPFAGATNPMSVSVGPGGTEYVGVWIDYDQSGTFDPAEFTLLGSGNGVTINGNIVVPATATLGSTRMRVRVQFNTAVLNTQACTPTSGFGEVEDYTVNIIPCVPVNITTQPSDVTVACGGNAVFTTAASGSLPTYSWQYRTSSNSTWQVVNNVNPFSNATTASLTVSSSTNINGYQFRAIVSGACTGLTNSNIATLNVNAITALITPSATQTICAGSNAIIPISIGNTGASTTTTFASAANLALAIPENGTGVTNVVNATLPATSQITDIKVKFNITHTWGGDLIMALKAPNGQVFNLSYALNGTDNGPGGFTNTIVSLNPLNALGAAYPLLSTGATPFTNTYKADGRTAATATALDNGVNSAVRPTGPTGFTATTSIPADIYGSVGSGTGAWTLAMYDFYDDGANGGAINRLVNWSMDITYGALASGVFTQAPASPNTIFTDAAATIAYDGITPINKVYVKPAATTTYSVAINTGICTTSGTLTVNVNTAPAGTLLVAPVTTCNGSNALFSFTGLTAGTGLSYQWQVSTPTVPTFTNIAGATSATYAITGASSVMNGNKYRVLVSAMGCMISTSITSTDGLLVINPTPSVTITASPITKLFPGLTTTLRAAVSPTVIPANGYQWIKNGIDVVGAKSDKLVVNIDALGTYTVRVSDVNGCASALTTPTSITISDSVNKETLFIYPSPNTGKFQVRYYSDLNDTKNTPGYVQIFDAKGARVFTRTYSPGTGYGSMSVDLGTHGTGIYRVDVLNSKGERIKTGSVMVF